ncbi:MAG: DUF2835 domain-containing protein, partial [Francisellaceae bacterium]|nr:DUF2835 domain-containing protein [Francisellaceae bacterium]
MPKTVVTINIPEKEILKYYSGVAKNILAPDINGVHIQFPASILRSFVTKEGIQGTFEIEFDNNGK